MNTVLSMQSLLTQEKDFMDKNLCPWAWVGKLSPDNDNTFWLYCNQYSKGSLHTSQISHLATVSFTLATSPWIE